MLQTRAAAPVTAVLGPTNTGKTHLAIERMLGHASGMIGLPLRLLAREIYDRVRLRTGDHAVALITGEEKIIPAQPRYWICTVEAMPPDIDVHFLAIDEVQIANDLERGHVFTDRILNRRGREETMLLGAATMRGILERLLPGTQFTSRPRLSRLTYAGQKKLTRLPRRTAIVAFTAEMVYTVAELIRRQRGGAAVVMGALSPRTRNAQVALYQSGDVDYIVATDAIGMGLNMDVDHVAFASTRKFDGFHFRNLTPSELGQVAGRAGRFMNDGTFGVAGETEPFDQETVDRLENHNFDSVKTLQWRNRDLDFRSLDSLRKSLGYFPKQEGLTRAQNASDIMALEAVLRDPTTADLVTSHQDVLQAWEVCQIPDYRNISPAEHAHLVCRIITFMKSGRGHIPEDWFARQLSHCENLEGGIDALSTRISHVRTWTFIANRADWLEAPMVWQSRTREIEDRLSDVLHERLTQRFIDRRSSVLMRRLAKKEGLMTNIEDDGAIHVEGEFVGRIRGLSFIPDQSLAGAEARPLKTAAIQALSLEISARAKSLAMTADTELKLLRDGKIAWQGHAVGSLAPSDTRLKPRIEVIADDTLAATDKAEIQTRLEKYLTRHIASLIEPLQKLEEAEGFEGLARGLAYRISENLGVLPRDQVAEDVKALSQDDRAKLRAQGVRFGAYTVFLPAVLKPAATELRLLLWWLEHHRGEPVDNVPAPPANGLTSVTADPAKQPDFYRVCGYRLCGPRAVRVDMLERLADMIRDRVFWKPRISEEARPAGSVEGGGFTVFPDLMSLVGCSGEDFERILENLGFRAQKKAVPKPAGLVAKTEAKILEEPSTTEQVTSEIAGETQAELPLDSSNPSEPTAQVEASTEPAAESGAEPLTAPPEVEAAATPSHETIEVSVWWPKDTGPFRRQHKRPEHKKPERHNRSGKQGSHDNKVAHQNGDKPDRKAFGRGKPNKHHRKPERNAPPPKREKPMDPNSPFAVLSALKSQMKDGGN
jgi:ATP-dependent RNA helicase SUPV3L1/SUV3